MKETYQNEDAYRVDTPKDSVVTKTMNLDKLEEPVRLEFRSDIDILKCEGVDNYKGEKLKHNMSEDEAKLRNSELFSLKLNYKGYDSRKERHLCQEKEINKDSADQLWN